MERAISLMFLMFGFLAEASEAAHQCDLLDLQRTLQDENPKAVKTLEQRWAQAYAQRDVASLDCLLADYFQVGSIPDLHLETHNKQELLRWVATRTGSAELGDVQRSLKCFRMSITYTTWLY